MGKAIFIFVWILAYALGGALIEQYKIIVNPWAWSTYGSVMSLILCWRLNK